MSTPIQHEHLVAQYLFTKLPRSLAAAYNTLASLKYPINDKQSLAAQLEGLGSSNQDPAKTGVSAVDLIRGSFSVFDFPIQTPQSALEKFDGRVLEPRGGPLPDPSSGNETDRIAQAEIYNKKFGPLCGAFATNVYLDRLRAHFPEWVAISAGEKDGHNCRDNIGFVAGPCFDVALRAYFEARASDSTDPQAWAVAHEAGLRCSSFPVPHLPPPIPPGP